MVSRKPTLSRGVPSPSFETQVSSTLINSSWTRVISCLIAEMTRPKLAEAVPDLEIGDAAVQRVVTGGG